MHLADNTLLQGGKYRIVRFISSGGFGCTYEAEHVMLHKKVAIKEFFVKDFCNRDETTSQISVGITTKTALVAKLKKKFVDEARSLCALEHPNIVQVFDVFDEFGTAYYVMDYIDGLSLNDMVKRDGPMSEQKALGYIQQVASALQYVHSQNRLHLDIKPGNIMVDSKDNAYLIDFGASKQYDEEGGENTSTLMGKTPGYAPLEQMGNDVVKFLPSTDIYALGATLYKLVSGVTPPSASLLASGETLDEMPSTISEATQNAIIAAMRTNKMKRPQSIPEFLNMIFSESDTDSTIVDDDDDGSTKAVDTMSSTMQYGAPVMINETPADSDSEIEERETPADGNVSVPYAPMFSKLHTSKGRISRKEFILTYVLYLVLTAIVNNVLIPIMGVTGIVPILYVNYVYFCQGAKRCHDMGKSGWWQLTIIYFIPMMFMPSKPGTKHYIENP